MASDAMRPGRDSAVEAQVVDGSMSAMEEVWQVIKTILKPVASLRLTVIMFAFSIILVLVGTLAQAKLDMWEVMELFFRSWVAWVELSVFAPPAWFPDVSPFWISFCAGIAGGILSIIAGLACFSNIKSQHTRTPIAVGAFCTGCLMTAAALMFRGFYFPGGLTIGWILFANLLAAHLVRFTIRGRGLWLLLGLVIFMFGLGFGVVVILAGHGNGGLQGLALISWEMLWILVKAGLALTCFALLGALIYMIVSVPGWLRTKICFGVGWLLIASFTALLYFTGNAMYLGDAGMRILWQLIQAEAVALVLLVGSCLIFNNRGGIVLIHMGVGLLMLNEIYVSRYSVEERLQMSEGETTNRSIDIRAVELAVIDTSGKENQVTVIPLAANGRQTRFMAAEEKISDRRLPFDIEIVKYLKNTEVPRKLRRKEKTPATAGLGKTHTVDDVRSASGADSGGEVNAASAFVKFTGKEGGKNYGTYLLTQSLMAPEQVTVGDKTYDVSLRFKHTYKPYSMRLIDVRKDDYTGTNTPRNYSSDVQFVDNSKNIDRKVHIWMNNPLRYGNETFYQSGYHMGSDNVETTTLQVVTNTGWMIPYVGCMVVATGLFVHFILVFIRFTRRLVSDATGTAVVDENAALQRAMQQSGAAQPVKSRKPKKPAPERPAPIVQAPDRSGMVGWIVPALLLAFCALCFASKVRPRSVAKGKVDYTAAGKLALADHGRVKPFDSLARESLRLISERETYHDEFEVRQPAIRWLLDVISGSDAADEHKVFRITSLDVLDTLDLKRRRGFRYSFKEIEPKMDEFRKQLAAAREVPSESMEKYQKKLIELDNRLQRYFALREAFRLPDPKQESTDLATYLSGMVPHNEQMLQSVVPLAVPSNSPSDKPWIPMSVAASRVWIRDQAKQAEATTTVDLATEFVNAFFTKENVEKAAEAELLNTMKQIMAGQDDSLSPAELDKRAVRQLAAMPAELREQFLSKSREEIVSSRPQLIDRFVGDIEAILGTGELEDKQNASAVALLNILSAYRDGKAEEFNSQVADYQESLASLPSEEVKAGKARFEAFFNGCEAFYYCTVCYVSAAILAAVSWLFLVAGWQRPFSRAAFWIILMTFAVHTFALVARIIIAERPPVTNLYSSAIFIGWGCVLFGLVLEALFKESIGNFVAALAGFSTLLIAQSLSTDLSSIVSSGGDNIGVMQAVLDTQFWLGTHVICITFGYATTFVAGLLGVVFITLGMFTPVLAMRIGRWNVGKMLGVMIYGTVCFSIFFSFFGTVLGGLWADDSWGRFWGWDPKENGALIIVLWNALILHARWGGIVKERGLAVLAVGGNIVTSWSWFGVNQLGIGLHSYGFTDGLLRTLAFFVLSQLAIILVGSLPKMIWWSYAAPNATEAEPT